jgi:hypothetical protein
VFYIRRRAFLEDRHFSLPILSVSAKLITEKVAGAGVMGYHQQKGVAELYGNAS